MIAYNREWLDALLFKDIAQGWQDNGLISKETLEILNAKKRSDFYSPNLFIRIGLGLFCAILMFAVMGLFALFGLIDSEAGITAFCLFFGIVWIILLEVFIQSRRHFGSGIDDMMLYIAIGTILAGFYAPLPYDADELVYCFMAWPVLVLACIRYTDKLLAVAAFGCTLFIVLLLVNKIPGLALYLLPFAGMAFSMGAWAMARSGQQRVEWRYWYGPLWVVELLSLLTFYASGNYWVVQQAGEAIFGLTTPPMGGFFWAFTFAIPALYIVQGLRLKDRFLLDTGILTVAVSIFTFRYYHYLLPLAWACTIIGAFVFAATYISIHYLRTYKGAYTYEPGKDAALLQEIEEQLIEQFIAAPTGRPDPPKESFGGGDFGGGGAGGEY